MDLQDKNGRRIRLTDERLAHLESAHPEMRGQVERIEETLHRPQRVVRSKSDFHRQAQARRIAMGDEIRLWYDKEADYLEVLFETREGYFQKTENDAVMEKVDRDGNVVGFSVLNVSGLSQAKPLSVHLKKHSA